MPIMDLRALYSGKSLPPGVLLRPLPAGIGQEWHLVRQVMALRRWCSVLLPISKAPWADSEACCARASIPLRRSSWYVQTSMGRASSRCC